MQPTRTDYLTFMEFMEESAVPVHPLALLELAERSQARIEFVKQVAAQVDAIADEMDVIDWREICDEHESYLEGLRLEIDALNARNRRTVSGWQKILRSWRHCERL